MTSARRLSMPLNRPLSSGLMLAVGLTLGACSTAPSTPDADPAPAPRARAATPLPLASPAQILAVKDAIHPGETVYVTTRATPERACELRIVDVTRVDDTTLTGSEHIIRGPERFQPFTMALGDIASLEVSRPIRGTDGDEDPQWGLSDRLADRVGDKSSLVLMMLQPLVVAAQVPYYGAKYTFQAAQGQLGSPATEPSEALHRAAATCAMPGLGREVPLGAGG